MKGYKIVKVASGRFFSCVMGDSYKWKNNRITWDKEQEGDIFRKGFSFFTNKGDAQVCCNRWKAITGYDSYKVMEIEAFDVLPEVYSVDENFLHLEKDVDFRKCISFLFKEAQQ